MQRCRVFFEIIIGFVIGLLIAMTGIGGGALMMPILLLMGLPPLSAVGTDIFFNFITKAWSMILHFSKNKIKWKIITPLLIGIIIANVISYFIFSKIEQGVAFYFVIVILLLGASINLYRYIRKRERRIVLKMNHWIYFVMVGVFISLLVNITSIGVGLLLTLFLLYFTNIDEKSVVRTDLTFGFFATLLGSVFHYSLGTINYSLVGLLVIGSLPGAFVGYRIHNRINLKKFRLILTLIILIAALFLLARELSFI